MGFQRNQHLVLKSIKDLERVGDLCINLTQFFEAVYDEKDDFSSEAKDDIIAMINMDIEMLNHAMVAFDKHDLDDIIYVDDHESNLDYYNKKAKQRHIQRVTNKTEKSVIVNSTYVDILSNLERIGDHCQNIAESYMLESPPNVSRKPEVHSSKMSITPYSLQRLRICSR